MAETTWRWVTEPKHGDPDDCNNVLVERTRNDAMGMTSTVDRVILRCGNIDAEDKDGIRAGRLALAACKTLVRQWDRYHADDGSVSPHDYFDGSEFEAARAAIAAARGEEVPDGQ